MLIKKIIHAKAKVKKINNLVIMINLDDLDFDKKPRRNYEEENKVILLKIIMMIAVVITLFTALTLLFVNNL